MKQYRLLRNNRESGPYSAEQLIQSGLKAYDLIWEEGKSAAWRYPSEVEALKPYAPVVEEQPFDRFFKKKPAQASQTIPDSKPSLENATVTSAKKEKPRIRIKADTHKIEPGPAPVIFQKEEKKEPVIIYSEPGPAKKKQQEPAWEAMWLDWEQEKKAVESLDQDNYTPEVTVKFSQSLDEIKQQYAETVLKPGKNTDLFGTYKNYIVLFIIAATVLGTGVWLGIRWGNEKNISPQQQAITTPELQTAEEVFSGNEDQSSQTTAILQDNSNTLTENKTAEIVVAPAAEKKNRPVKAQQKSILQKTTDKKTNTAQNAAVQTRQDNIVKQERLPASQKQSLPVNNTAAQGETHRQDNIFSRNTKPAPTISDYIAVRNISSSTTATGVQYKMENISETTVELVMIDLQYFDAGGKYLKGQTVYVRNIKPGETAVVKAPDDSNAARVSYKIAMVTSEKDNLYLIAD